MRYTVDRVIGDVRQVLEHGREDGDLLMWGDPDAASLEAVITSHIEDGVRMVHCAAPLHLLDGGVDFSASDVAWDDTERGTGYVLLPRDFMRLVSFRMEGWQRPVSEPLTEGDAAYLAQSSPYLGLRGNPERPVCALVQRPVGLVLEFYSAPGGKAAMTQARYLPLPAIGDDSAVDICEQCYRAVVHQVASLAAAALGAAEQAALLAQQANDLMTWRKTG